MSHLKEINSFDCEIKETLEGYLKEHKNISCLMIVGINKDTSLFCRTTSSNGFEKASMVEYAQYCRFMAIAEDG